MRRASAKITCTSTGGEYMTFASSVLKLGLNPDYFQWEETYHPNINKHSHVLWREFRKKNFRVAWSSATLIYNHRFAKPEIQGKSFILNHRIRLLATVDSLPAHGNKLIRCILNLSSKRNLCSHIFKPYYNSNMLSNYNPLLGGRIWTLGSYSSTKLTL